jgi:predicted nucleotide-binding protein (sugar kinase/HSP70/actin superfamily)
MTGMERLEYILKKRAMTKYEKRIKNILSASGLFKAEPLHIETIVKNAAAYISPLLNGEAVLTVGSSLTEVVSEVCGVIAIGPFGCMPNRLSESILSEAMNSDVKLATDPQNKRLRTILTDIDDLPFLSIESDGSPFPQLVHAKLETLLLRAGRLNERMRAVAHQAALSRQKQRFLKTGKVA